MSVTIKRTFLDRWEAYFPGAELPIVFGYTNEEVSSDIATSGQGFGCFICDLAPVREGATRYFNAVDPRLPEAVITPFGSGCSSIVYHPYQELRSDQPRAARAVLGMFDVSARPCVAPNVLSFAVPWPKFAAMVKQMDESFLITSSWREVRSRL